MGHPWQAREQPSLFGVEATAVRLGRALWVEQQLFEITGRWVTEVPEASVKERLAAHCHRHAAHMAAWRDRSPQATGVDGAAMVLSPGAGVESALALLSTPTLTVVRLAGLYRVVVARLVAAHTFHRNVTNSVADGPTATLLDTVVAGLMDEWRDGEMMIETLLDAAESREDVTAELGRHQAAVESAIVSAGGVLGPGTMSA